jgi:hypothetical protein
VICSKHSRSKEQPPQQRNSLQQPRFASPLTRLGAAEGTSILHSNAAQDKDAGCHLGSATLFSAPNANGQTLLLAQVAVRVLGTLEERGQWRERGRRSGCCSSSGRVALLLMVAVVALGAMLVSCCLPQSTHRALEL